MKKLWVGLGNPGRQYAKTRHNIGADILLQLAGELSLKEERSLKALVGKRKTDGDELIFLFPLTFMNLSGEAVVAALKTFSVEPGNLLVFHDEIDLPPGELRYKFGGGHNGHNGLRDIINRIGTGDFHRLRLGVGRPENAAMSVADYVLSRYNASDLPSLESVEQLLAEHHLR